MKQIFKPFFKADKFARESRCCDVQLGSQQVHLPTHHTLKNFNSFIPQYALGQKKFVSEVDMYKGKSHSVATNNPTSMGNEIFIACGRVSPKSNKEPAYSHDSETKRGYASADIINSQWYNGNSAQKASNDIESSKGSVERGSVFQNRPVEQDRA